MVVVCVVDEDSGSGPNCVSVPALGEVVVVVAVISEVLGMAAVEGKCFVVVVC
jgi:hypothetical protein